MNNSILAYISILEELPERRMQVYKGIEENQPVSNRQLSKILSLEINCITGRTNELVKLKLVIEDKKVIDKQTKKLVSLWKVKHKLR